MPRQKLIGIIGTMLPFVKDDLATVLELPFSLTDTIWRMSSSDTCHDFIA